MTYFVSSGTQNSTKLMTRRIMFVVYCSQTIICLYLIGIDVVCCKCRVMAEVRIYWLGLYLITSEAGSGNAWYAARWYDGSLSTYTYWATGYPSYPYERCVCYTISGWQDVSCDSEFYFISRKPAGNSKFSLSYCSQLQLHSRFSIRL